MSINAAQSAIIDEIVDLLNPTQRLFFVTGAGMSAESGLPTYRGVSGLYNSGETEEGLPIERLLSASVFREKPKLTWKYLAHIGNSASKATFNRGHEILAELAELFADVCILTQNIDGFHLAAGSNNVIEIHGNICSLSCTECDYQMSNVEKFSDLNIPPYCDRCQAVMRPDVVLFDEMLPKQALNQLQRQWDKGFDVVFSIGTTSVFPYIAEPVFYAADNDLPAIEINPTKTNVTGACRYVLDLPASVALEQILSRFQART